jgi:hypothetical protein
MKIIVSEIPEEGIELDLKDDIKSDVVSIVSPVKSVMRLVKIEDEVMVKGALTAESFPDTYILSGGCRIPSCEGNRQIGTA